MSSLSTQSLGIGPSFWDLISNPDLTMANSLFSIREDLQNDAEFQLIVEREVKNFSNGLNNFAYGCSDSFTKHLESPNRDERFMSQVMSEIRWAGGIFRFRIMCENITDSVSPALVFRFYHGAGYDKISPTIQDISGGLESYEIGRSDRPSDPESFERYIKQLLTCFEAKYRFAQSE